MNKLAKEQAIKDIQDYFQEERAKGVHITFIAFRKSLDAIMATLETEALRQQRDLSQHRFKRPRTDKERICRATPTSFTMFGINLKRL